MREQISLNGTWQLKGTASYVPLRDRSIETGKPLAISTTPLWT